MTIIDTKRNFITSYASDITQEKINAVSTYAKPETAF